MAKINIIEKSHDIEGTLKKGIVKPFGTSAHITFPKEYNGMVVNVIIPDEPLYTWLFDENLRKKLSEIARKLVPDGRNRVYMLDCIDEFMEKEFPLDSLIKVISIFEDKKTLEKETTLIKKMYGI